MKGLKKKKKNNWSELMKTVQILDFGNSVVRSHLSLTSSSAKEQPACFLDQLPAPMTGLAQLTERSSQGREPAGVRPASAAQRVALGFSLQTDVRRGRCPRHPTPSEQPVCDGGGTSVLTLEKTCIGHRRDRLLYKKWESVPPQRVCWK